MNGIPVEDDEPAWRKLKLTLERPYKDDQGNDIRQLLDVTPEGQQIYEPCARISSFFCNGRLFMPPPGLRITKNISQRISTGCLLSEATTFSRREMLPVGELTPGTLPASLKRTKKATPKRPVRLRNP